jgi:glycosyltransferase involved in cell wall biosynthesis
MFEEIKSRPGWSAVFAGRRSPEEAHASIELMDDGTFALTTSSELFRFHNSDQDFLFETLPKLIEWAKPDVIHFHHYVQLGLEAIRVIRNFCPKTPIILTLHEFLAICNNNGQMLRVNAGGLCHKATPMACNRCFPSTSPEDFFLRERLIKRYLDIVDHFISPSHFLKQRYVDWGLSPDKISVIENGQPPAEPLPPRSLANEHDRRGRFAFFGQLNPFKGIDILLDAMNFIPPTLKSPQGPISLSIHGSGLQWQEQKFQDKLNARVLELSGCAHLHGRYEPGDLPRLMAGIDWVVMPSIWWENSPLVIQEAQKFGRPLIVSGIGGMAEKVQNGVNGLHVRPGDPQGLAHAMVAAATEQGLWEKLAAGTIRPPTISETVDEVMGVYETVTRADQRRCLQPSSWQETQPLN